MQAAEDATLTAGERMLKATQAATALADGMLTYAAVCRRMLTYADVC
jgi:hypothetical protein